MNRICPTCGESAGADDSKNCAVCGAILPTPTSADSGEPGLRTTRAESDEANGDSPAEQREADTDELTAAFRAQFERHQVVLPEKWIQRLRKLAAEAEVSHRFAAVIFVDLRGYTKMIRVLSNQQTDELRQWFYRLATARIEQHGGFVIQFLGDAVFAAFGAPWAFERDCESAVHALVDIREDVLRQREFEGQLVAVRAGASFGPLDVRITDVQGQPRIDVYGPTVNLAARLEEQAETGEILAAPEVAEQVRSVFELKPRPTLVPKGYESPIEPYAVVGLRQDQESRRRHDMPLVGRSRHIELLTARLADVRHGAFRAVRLEGEAGIGKSRLFAELRVSSAADDFTFVPVSCEPHDRFALFHAAILIVRQLLAGSATIKVGYDPEEGIQDADGLLASLAAFPTVAPETAPNLGYLLGVEPYASNLRVLSASVLKNQVVSSVASLIGEATKAGPILIFIDDIQWCDRLSLEVFNRLLAEQPAGLFLLSAGRQETQTEEYFRDPRATSAEARSLPAGSENWETLALEALSAEEQQQLLSQIVDLEGLPGPLVRQVLTQTEGIPYYLIEIAREIDEGRSKSLSESLAQHASAGPSANLPPGVLDILQARIDRLTVQGRAIVQCGSILGRRFSYSLLSLYEKLRENLIAELYLLKGLRVLREEPLPEDVQFVFTPTVLRDVAYHMLNAKQKQQLHRTVAGMIQERFKDRLNDFSFELAYHWLRGNEIVRSRRFMRRAISRALEMGTPQDAYELIHYALQPVAPSEMPTLPFGISETEMDLVETQQRGLLHEAGGRACRLMADLDKSDFHFREFLAIAEEVHNAGWRSEAWLNLGMNAFERSDHSAAEELLKKSVELSPSGNMNFAARNLLGLLKLRTNDPPGALAVFLELEKDLRNRPDEETRLGNCWNNLGLVYKSMDWFDDAQQAYSNALTVWRRKNNLFGQALTLNNLGIVLENVGRFNEALSVYEEARETSDRIGFFHGLSAINANVANICLLRQRFDRAKEHSTRALKYAQIIQNRHSESIALVNLGLSLGESGFIEDALTHFDEALRLGREMRDNARINAAQLARAWILLRSGKDNEARGALQLDVQQLTPDHSTWHETLVGTCDSLDEQREHAIFTDAALEELRQKASRENYVRRLDAISLLSQRGLKTRRIQEIEERRRIALPN